MAAKTGILPSNDEQFAYDLVSDDLGVQVSHHDTGLRRSGGMVDGLIHLADGTSAALEVITDADGEVMALWRAIEKEGNTFNIVGLANGWYIHVNHSTRIKKLKPQLAAFLQFLERLKVGSTLDLMPSRYWPNAEVFSEMNRNGVTSATAHSGNPGDVQLVPVAWSGSAGVGFAPLVEWIDAMFNDNLDVAIKLVKHEDATERHAFIWATSSSPYGLIYILKNSDPVWGAPSPNLPDGVTHLWVGGLRTRYGSDRLVAN